MSNKKINQIFIVFVVVSFTLLSCTRNKDKTNNNRLTALAIIYGDSLAFFTTFNSIIKVENLKTNKILYELKIDNNETVIPSLLIEKFNYLYFPFNDTLLHCVNFRSKKMIWNFKTGGTIKSLKQVNDSIVLIGVRGIGVIAVNTFKGNKVYQVSDSTSSSCNSSSEYDLIFDKEFFFVSDSYCNSVTSFNAKNGGKIWGYNFKIVGSTRLLLIKDLVFCGITGNPMKNEGAIVLLDKHSGKVVFEKKESFDLITKPVLYKDKVIYYNYDYKLNEFDLNTKTTKVIYQFKKANFGCGNQFFLKDDAIYFNDCKFNLNQFNLKTYQLKVLGKSNGTLLGVYKNKNEIRFLY